MKTITVNAIITSLRAKSDRSISFTVSTPELTPSEKALFFELQNINSEINIKPLDEFSESIKIDTDIESKTQSERIRNVLYVLWKQNPDGDFQDYYRKRTEKIINWLKREIDNE